MIDLCLAVALAASAAAPEKKAMEWKGNGGPERPGHEVIMDAASWTAAFKRLGREAPPLDFKVYAAVMVHAGERPTGGWRVEFGEPKADGKDLVVTWRLVEPKGFVTQAFTTPWAAKAFPRPKGRLRAEAAAP